VKLKVKPNPLFIIAFIFAGSFMGRIIGVADAALNTPEKPAVEMNAKPKAVAKKEDMHKDEAHQETASKYVEAPASPAPSSMASTYSPGEKSELLIAIKERAENLDAREIAIEDRIRFLEIIETRVEKKLAELKKSNESLSSLVAYADEASQNDIALLSRMYEQMKPAKAGEIFDKMDPNFAAGFLTQMNSENAALILTNMNTDKAYETSMIIASRNAAVHSQ